MNINAFCLTWFKFFVTFIAWGGLLTSIVYISHILLAPLLKDSSFLISFLLLSAVSMISIIVIRVPFLKKNDFDFARMISILKKLSIYDKIIFAFWVVICVGTPVMAWWLGCLFNFEYIVVLVLVLIILWALLICNLPNIRSTIESRANQEALPLRIKGMN